MKGKSTQEEFSSAGGTCEYSVKVTMRVLRLLKFNLSHWPMEISWPAFTLDAKTPSKSSHHLSMSNRLRRPATPAQRR